MSIYIVHMDQQRTDKMKKLAVLLSYIIFITGCFIFKVDVQRHNISNKILDKNELIERIDDTTVVLTQPVDGERHAAYCTGVWIDKGVILTAYHCVEAGALTEVEMFITEMFDIVIDEKTLINRELTFTTNQQSVDTRRYRMVRSSAINVGNIIAVNRNSDLALVRANVDTAYITTQLSKKRIRRGDRLYVTGHTAGLPYTYSEVLIANERIMTTVDGNKPVKVLQLSGPVWRGNSGGGAFDERGKLMGICSFLIRGTSNITFFIHRDEISKFMRDNEPAISL